jgi:sec-independent protein translocase protein TatA
MMGISFEEIFVIVFFVVLLFGPKNIPNLMRTFGRTYRQINESIQEVKYEINREVDKTKDDLPRLDNL